MLQSQDRLDFAYSIGLDASITSFGLFCEPLNDEREHYNWIVKSDNKQSDAIRVMEMALCIIEDLSNVDKVILTIEDYGPINKTAGKVAQRAELCGIIKYHALTVWNIPVVTVPPNSLKSFATGKGNATKDEVMSAAAREGHYFTYHDEADAYFCSKVGKRIVQEKRVSVDFTRTNPR